MSVINFETGKTRQHRHDNYGRGFDYPSYYSYSPRPPQENNNCNWQVYSDGKVRTTTPTPSLSELFEWNVESQENYGDVCSMNLWESRWKDDRATIRIYSTSFYSNLPVFENSILLRNDGYQINATFLKAYRLSTNVQNTPEETTFQLIYYINGFHEYRPILTFRIGMNESVTEKYKLKFQKDFGRGLEKILDGWLFDHFGATGYIKTIANELIPRHLADYLTMDTIGFLKRLVSRFLDSLLRRARRYLRYLYYELRHLFSM